MFLQPLAHWRCDARARHPVRAATVAAPPGHGGHPRPIPAANPPGGGEETARRAVSSPPTDACLCGDRPPGRLFPTLGRLLVRR
ncbi:MAG: hypothetical protein N2378_08620, partial [Chloroflexaceae bacterium]|nr:hypothetical protein [Chloroflexaceae bacterium]